MEYLASTIVSYLSNTDLLEIALKDKTPSQIERLVKPYNDIVKLKCKSCDNIVKPGRRCVICHKQICETCTDYECTKCNVIACHECVYEDEYLLPIEVIELVLKCYCNL